MVNSVAWRVKPKLVFGLMAALGAGSFLLYLSTMCPGVYPGESASVFAALLGGDAGFDRMPAHSLFYFLAWGLLKLFPVSFPAVLNFFSVVCGTLSVMLFFFLSLQWLLRCSREEITNDIVFDPETGNFIPNENSSAIRHNERSVNASCIGAAVAAVLFATSIPFWSMSTRLCVETFDCMLLLITLNLTLSALEFLGKKDVLLAVFLIGMCCLQSMWFLIAGPLLLVVIGRELFLAGCNEEERPTSLSVLVAGSLGVVAALSSLFLLSTQVMDCGFRGAPRLLLQQLLLEMEGWVPRGYWLSMLFQTIVPVSLAAIFSYQCFRRRNWWFFSFQCVLAGAVLISLYDLPFSTGYRMRLTGCAAGVELFSLLDAIVPAMVCGVLIASWRLLKDPVSERVFDEPDYEGAADHKSLGYVGMPASVFLAVLAIGGFVFRCPMANGRAGIVADRIAEKCLSQIPDGALIYGESPIRNNLFCTVKRLKRDVRFIPREAPSAMNEQERTAFLRRLNVGGKPFYDVVLAVGVDRFLEEWLLNDPAADRKLICFDRFVPQYPALSVFPNGLFTFAGQMPKTACPEQMKKSVDMSLEIKAMQTELSSVRPLYLKRFQDDITRSLSRIVNNSAVLCGESGFLEAERLGYRQALVIDPGNPAPMVNLLTGPAVQDGVDKGQNDWPSIVRAALLFRSLTEFERICGDVRDMDTASWFRENAELRARPHPSEIAELRRKRLLSECTTAVMLGNYGLSEDRTRLLAAEYPQDLTILSIRALSLAGTGDYTGSQSVVSELRRLGLSEGDLIIPLTFLELCRGDHVKAHARLQAAVHLTGIDGVPAVFAQSRKKSVLGFQDPQTEDLLLLSFFAQSLIQLGRSAEAEIRVLPAMYTANERKGHYLIYKLQGDLMYSKGLDEYVKARDFYRLALGLYPDAQSVRDRILEIDYRLDYLAQAEADACEELRRNANHSFANAVLGHTCRLRGKLDAAEYFLRKSIAASPNTLAHIEMAGIFYEKGDWESAEKNITRALTLDEKSVEGWAMLAKALLKRNKLPEAAIAAERAVLMRDDVLMYKLILARVRALQGRRDDAMKILYPHMARRDREPKPVRDEFEAVLEVIRTY